MRIKLLALSGLLIFAESTAHASWLSRITGVDIKVRSNQTSIEINRPEPEAIPEAIRNFPQDALNFLNPAGTTLAVAIRDARSNVRSGGSKIPDHVKDRLSPFIPMEIMDRVRWKVNSQKGFGLDSLVLQLSDGTDAITLDDAIVFRQNPIPAPGVDDLDAYELWAHELLHVIQYQNMGVEAFANTYVFNSNGIESQAYDGAAEIRRQMEQGNTKRIFESQSYSSLQSIGSAPLTTNQFRRAAMSSIPPHLCVEWRYAPYGADLRNICSVNVAINNLVKVNPLTNQSYVQPCYFNCFLGAGQQMAYQSPNPGPIINIGFQFVP